jgi:SSS family solute:Na+ symporter
VRVGRLATAFFVVAGCLWAPFIASFEGVFTYIQMVWGFISPGIVVAFVVGMISKRTPPRAAVGAMIIAMPVYGLLLWSLPDIAFLHHMMITGIVVACYMGWERWQNPLAEPVILEDKGLVDLTSSPSAYIFGALIVLAVAGLYIMFW